jgi:glucose/arabinose dehydrogenase
MNHAFRTGSLIALGVVVLGALTVGQQPSPAQPRADQLPPVGPPRTNRGATVPRPAGVMPTAPPGFTVSEYAELQGARMMVYAANGDLFVSSPTTNSITVLRDANQDGTFEARSVFAQGEMAAPRGGGGAGRGGPRAGGPPTIAPATAPVNPEVNGPVLGVNAPGCAPPPAFHNPGPGTLGAPFGLAFHGGYLYVGNTTSLIRYRYSPGDLTAQGQPEKLLDLPQGGHNTRNVVFNRAGTKMYLAVGSASNNTAGEDCRRAAILEFNPDGSGYRVFASGLRNPVGLAWQIGTDTLWTAVNERDNLGDDLVPDYATSVRDGGFYGWPYSYLGQNYDPRYQGAFPDLVKRAIVPDVLLPAHAAALGITFYDHTQFPQRYRNGGFVALHGSWNRSTASGYKVVFFPMTNGRPGPIEDFLSGFVVNDGSGAVGIERWGRPVGVTVTPDGSLLVSDDASHRIWRVRAGK